MPPSRLNSKCVYLYNLQYLWLEAIQSLSNESLFSKRGQIDLKMRSCSRSDRTEDVKIDVGLVIELFYIVFIKDTKCSCANKWSLMCWSQQILPNILNTKTPCLIQIITTLHGYPRKKYAMSFQVLHISTFFSTILWFFERLPISRL